MRFLRQLAAVLAVVTAVVLIGLAWHHFAPGSFGGQGVPGPQQLVVRGQAATAVHRGGKVTPGLKLNSGPSGVPPIQLGDLLEPVNLAVLWHTAWIEAAVVAAVVIVDAGRRRWRRASRLSR